MTQRSIVVISGSTRSASTSSAFARTAAAHPTDGATVTAWLGLTGLPPNSTRTCTVLSDKPVACVKVAADARRGKGAHAELATVLAYVRARVLPQACLHVPRTGTLLTPAG